MTVDHAMVMTLTQAMVWLVISTVGVVALLVLGIYAATRAYNADRQASKAGH